LHIATVARFERRGNVVVSSSPSAATVTIVLVGVSQGMGDNTNDNLSLPGTDRQRA
jgi:hypothetical protein